jgi:hypothetical protein
MSEAALWAALLDPADSREPAALNSALLRVPSFRASSYHPRRSKRFCFSSVGRRR